MKFRLVENFEDCNENGKVNIESMNTRLHERDDSEFNRLRKAYKNYRKFKDIDAQSGDIRDLTDKLTTQNVPYEEYKHKTDKGITIFYDDINESLTEAVKPPVIPAPYDKYFEIVPDEELDIDWHAKECSYDISKQIAQGAKRALKLPAHEVEMLEHDINNLRSNEWVEQFFKLPVQSEVRKLFFKYAVERDEYGTGDVVSGATILGTVAAKDGYEDIFDSWYFLIDDPDFPVVEIVHDRLYPVDVPENLQEKLETNSKIETINDLASRVEQILKINYPTVLVVSDDQENGRIAVMHDDINKQESICSWCDAVFKRNNIKPKSSRIVNSRVNNGTYAIVFAGLNLAKIIRIHDDSQHSNSFNSNVSSTKYDAVMMEAFSDNFESRELYDTGELMLALRNLVKEYGHMELEKEIYLETVENDHGRQLKIGYQQVNEDIDPELNKKIANIRQQAVEYVLDRLSDFYMPEHEQDERVKHANNIVDMIVRIYPEMTDYVQYWGASEKEIDKLWNEGVREDITDELRDNFPESVISDYLYAKKIRRDN